MHNAKTVPTTRTVAISGNSFVAVGANPRRVALMIGVPAATAISVQFGAAGDTTTGIPLAAASPPLFITSAFVGAGVGEAFALVNGTGGAINVSFTEWLLEP